MLCAGMIVPVCACLTTFLQIQWNDPGLQPHATENKDRSQVPRFYWHGIELTGTGSVLDFLAFLSQAFSVLSFLVIFIISSIFYRGSPHFSRSSIIAFAAFLHIFIVITPTIFLSARTIFVSLSANDDQMRPRCVFMPCSPQSILELDQAFALLLGLAMIAYEYGPSIWHWLVTKYVRRPYRRQYQYSQLPWTGERRIDDEDVEWPYGFYEPSGPSSNRMS
ncbi:hypothetical protein CC86DRAFT_94045 [Ophiobolus disseminans]|uniref:Uncharacterized protein n=1 Tax=Ophiobolus disseminans TaxID=1469910 RepID=A0A6A6ZMD2_9PLEO|nr:hypothetical protein CC86DRAFT_94045 [Ophiobolus disseminans]